MESTTPLEATNGAENAPAQTFATIAEDRLEGAEAIGRFIGNLTPRETRRLLEGGHWPCWREGRLFVASKRALLAHWREKTAQFKPGQPQPAARQLTNRSARRGYLRSPHGQIE